MRVAACNRKGCPAEIGEDDADLAAVIGVDRPRAVEDGDPVFERKARARPNLCLPSLSARPARYRWERHALARRQDHGGIDGGGKIDTCAVRCRIGRQFQPSAVRQNLQRHGDHAYSAALGARKAAMRCAKRSPTSRFDKERPVLDAGRVDQMDGIASPPNTPAPATHHWRESSRSPSWPVSLAHSRSSSRSRRQSR